MACATCSPQHLWPPAPKCACFCLNISVRLPATGACLLLAALPLPPLAHHCSWHLPAAEAGLLLPFAARMLLLPLACCCLAACRSPVGSARLLFAALLLVPLDRQCCWRSPMLLLAHHCRWHSPAAEACHWPAVAIRHSLAAVAARLLLQLPCCRPLACSCCSPVARCFTAGAA